MRMAHAVGVAAVGRAAALALAAACVCAAAGLDKQTMKTSARVKIRDQLNSSEIRNIDKAYKPDIGKNENNLNIGSADGSIKNVAPRFRYPSRMYGMDMKPAGSSITLKCIAEGIPAPNITWKKNGGKFFNTYYEPTFGKWSMRLQELTKTDDGNYTCIVCNIVGCINHTTELHIQERYPARPHIQETHPGNHTVRVNATARLTCAVLSDLEPLVYWRRSPGGAEALGADTPQTIVESDNRLDKPEELTIHQVTKEDEGWYTCVALNSLGNDTSKGYLKVVESLPDEEPLPLLHKTKQTPDNSTKSALLTNVLMAVLAAMFVTLAVIAGMIFKKWKQEEIKKQLAIETARELITHWTKKVTVERPRLTAAGGLLMPVVKIEKQKLSPAQGRARESAAPPEYELPLDLAWEVDRDSLVIGKVLGEGEFGKVVKAECANILQQGVTSVVAVKMLKEGHSDDDMLALVSELELMKAVGRHAHVAALLGCCSRRGPLCVIVEYAPHGCLREFLRERRHNPDTEPLGEEETLTQKDLVSFSHQVASGMEYLASRRCIHRDLAARNVLVAAGRVLKVADFGLARHVRARGYYRKTTAGRLPVRWMAPESLGRMLFTTQTDVWSFGVLLWEIMTLGATPYPAVPAQYMHRYLRAGHRMKKPPDCSLEIYILMRKCWSYSPGDRPTFTELVQDLDKILQSPPARSSGSNAPQRDTICSPSEKNDTEWS